MKSRYKDTARIQAVKADTKRLLYLLSRIHKGLVPELEKTNFDNYLAEIFFNDADGKILKFGCLDAIAPENGVYKNNFQFRKIRNMALEGVQKELKSRIKFLEKYKLNRYPLKWMENDPLIAENMNKKGNRLFYPVFESLTEHKMPFAESRGFHSANASIDSPQISNPIIVKANQKELALCFESDSTTINRIFQEMVLYGIILPYTGLNGKKQSHYVLGRWSRTRHKNPRPIYFLKDSPKMRRALRNFRVSNHNGNKG